jgi:hypothetical protein
MWWVCVSCFRERPRRVRAPRAPPSALGSGARVCRLPSVASTTPYSLLWRLPSRGAARAALSGLRRADPARLHTVFTTSPRLALQMRASHMKRTRARKGSTEWHCLQVGGEASGRGRSRGGRWALVLFLGAPWRASCTKPSRLRAVPHRVSELCSPCRCVAFPHITCELA